MHQWKQELKPKGEVTLVSSSKRQRDQQCGSVPLTLTSSANRDSSCFMSLFLVSRAASTSARRDDLSVNWAFSWLLCNDNSHGVQLGSQISPNLAEVEIKKKTGCQRKVVSSVELLHRPNTKHWNKLTSMFYILKYPDINRLKTLHYTVTPFYSGKRSLIIETLYLDITNFITNWNLYPESWNNLGKKA